ncbi:MAG: hypothetical protein ACD_45C00605G0002 [uncultured bacterium]|nr:MAG: hypothetical protein ACD_45C00605G0002 [uncultured bacterium]
MAAGRSFRTLGPFRNSYLPRLRDTKWFKASGKFAFGRAFDVLLITARYIDCIARVIAVVITM